MKRSATQDQKCRRMEFKCRLYDIIKDLERSLKSECTHSGKGQAQSSPFGQSREYSGKDFKRKGDKCCCPPGCCKESMEFRLPKIPDRPGQNQQLQTAPAAEGSHLPWHDEDHSRGCRPDYGPGSATGYCCTDTPRQDRPQPFPLPTTEEEMHMNGCFIARAA